MKTSLTVKGNRLWVQTAYSPVLVERFRAIPGRMFDGDSKQWHFPVCPDVISMVMDVCGLLPWMLTEEVRQAIDVHVRETPRAKSVDRGVLNGHVWLVKPYDHQIENLARLLTEPRWLIADSMGLGKSAVVANRLKSLSSVQTLILCPKSVMSGWQDELAQHAGLDCILIDGDRRKREKLCGQERPAIKVVNYESLLYTPLLNQMAWKVLVLDEIHKGCKGFTNITAKSVRRLSEKADYVWGLSGTPAPQGLEDWLGVLSAIKRDHLPVQTKTAFEARYCVKSSLTGDGKPPFKITGYRNVQELHGYIASITSRFTKEEALDLPPRTFSSRTCTLQGEQARIYRDLKKDAVARIETMRGEGTLSINNILTEGLRLAQVIGGFFCANDGVVHELKEKAKLPILAEVLEEIGDEQAIIWCKFLPEVKMITAWLNENFGTTVNLVGETSLEDRFENIKTFRAGDAKYFVGTAAAGGTGTNLQTCSNAIYYSRDFNFATWNQSADRNYRIGSLRPVSVIKLIATGTVDVTIDRRLDEKGEILEAMLANPESML